MTLAPGVARSYISLIHWGTPGIRLYMTGDLDNAIVGTIRHRYSVEMESR